MSTEITILEERANKLQQTVEVYTTKYKLLLAKHESSEELIKQQKLEITQLNDLCGDYTAKYNEIVAQNELLTVQHQFCHHEQSSTENINTNSSATIIQLKKQLEVAERTIKAKDHLIDQKRQIIDSLNHMHHVKQSEDALRYKQERDNMQIELDNFAETAQQAVDKMQSEILMLTEKNCSLEKERDEMMQSLEKEMMEYYENGLLDKTSQEVMILSTKVAALEEERDQLLNMLQYTTRDYTKPKEKPKKEVADVTREYLHLTASVVSMKFPRVQHIPSEELINKVKNYNFWEYHDIMYRIMKTEEQKMLAKEKAQTEEKMKGKNDMNTVNESGMLGRFRSFFGGSGTGSSGSSNVKSVTKATDKKQIQKKRSAHVKKRLSLSDLKKNAKDFKDSIKHKPTEEEAAKMADLSFESVKWTDESDTDKIAKKPDQGL